MQFSGNSALFLGSFIAYIALMILIGWFASRKVSKGGTAFLTGGGHLPVFLTVCTAAATLIGTGGTMGRTRPSVFRRPRLFRLRHCRPRHSFDSRVCIHSYAQQKLYYHGAGNPVLLWW